MIKCQIRIISEDVLLDIIEMDSVPELGNEIVIDGQGYYVAAPPSEVTDDETIVYVSKLPV